MCLLQENSDAQRHAAQQPGEEEAEAAEEARGSSGAVEKNLS
jgi:hypothetical protein